MTAETSEGIIDVETMHIKTFYSARVKLSLSQCIGLLVVFITGKVLFSYRSYVQRHCCH